jgi:uncharacterized protein YqgC (DUF456 family)
MLDKVNPKYQKFYLQFINASGAKVDTMADGIIKQIAAKGFNVTNNIDEATMVLYITVKNLAQITEDTVNNVKKYMYYQDITDGVKLNNTENVGQKNLFAIADGSVSIASPGMNVSGTSVAKDNAISKLLAVDFVSGAALGAVIGFAISGVNPAGILIGAGVGAVVTSAVQKITEERYYIAAIGIKLATKSSHMVEGTQTLLMPQSSNMIKKVVSSFKDDWVERHTEMFVIAESFFWRSSAERQIAEIAAKSISALIY